MAEEQVTLGRWPLIPRWFKAVAVASPVFGVSLGSNGDVVLALAFAGVTIIIFLVGAACCAKWKSYRDNGLPS